MNTADCAREEFGHRKNGHVGEAFLLRKRDGVCDDDFFDGGIAQTFDRGSGQDTMRGATIDVARPVVVYYAYCLCQSAGGVDLVIHN